ncbi:MAG: hypothetical protein CMC12_03855 [Flavobacteriaceae bacterium]|nr:hypothetical protein [Flavobacteriaceae bacterium]
MVERFKIPLYCLSLLLIPMATMLISDEINWSIFDFLVMGVLLFSFGVSINIVLNNTKNSKIRITLFTLLILIFSLIWIELAVGIFESPFAGS